MVMKCSKYVVTNYYDFMVGLGNYTYLILALYLGQREVSRSPNLIIVKVLSQT